MGKKAYRKASGGTSVLSIAIIIMLVMIIITLSVIIAKKSGNKDTPDINSDIPSDTVAETAPPETEAPFDYTVFEKISCTDAELSKGTLVLVNRQTEYKFPDSIPLINLFSNKDRHYTVASADITLESEAYMALGKLTDAFYDETSLGILQITAGYRTEAQQEDYYSSVVELPEDADYFEAAGFSDHHTGYAFDVKLYLEDGTSLSYGKNASEHAPWVVENYHKYGFIMRYPGNKTDHTGIISEENHFRYVGVPHSVYMRENDLCLEEYISYLKSFSLEKPLEIPAGGKTYFVYYTQKTSDVTEVYVPKDGNYTLSGNNTDGFIVTYSQN